MFCWGTKMNYRLDRKTQRKKYFKIALGFAALGILFYFQNPLFRGVSRGAGEIFRPALFLGQKVGGVSQNLRAYFSSKTGLYAENEKLKQDLAMLNAQMADHQILTLENENLKNILARAPKNKNLVLAAILAKPPQSAYDTLILDVGQGEGVKAGARVYAYGEVPIGRIDSVSADVSKVVLYSTAGERTPVVLPVADKSDVFWELVGRGGGNFEMILPRDFVLSPGDTAVAPGIAPFAIATVKTLLSDPRDPFKKALLASPVNIQALKFVEVEL